MLWVLMKHIGEELDVTRVLSECEKADEQEHANWARY